MKILITGSNGLLGQKLVRLISQEEDVELIATSRGGNRLQGGSYTYNSLDITKQDECEEVIAKHQPKVIIHCAAMTQVDDCELDHENAILFNTTAVEYLVNAAKKIDAFFIHLSTDFIFDGSHGPLLENESPSPVNFYGETKLKAENIVINSGLKWAIARTVLVYGVAEDMSRSNIILWVKKNLEEGKPIQVVNDQWRTPTLAEDLAIGCYLIAKKRAEGVYNISGKDMLTPYEMAMKVVEHFKLDESLITKVDASIFSQPAKRPPKTGFVIDKAINELGYQPHSFEEGIAIVAQQVEKYTH